MRAAAPRAALTVVVALCLAALTACSDDGAGSASASSSASSSAGPAAPAASSSASAGTSAAADPSPGASTSVGTANSAMTPGDQPALQLAALLGQHSVLAADMMRARIRGDADLAQAADAALGQNTKAVGTVLAPYLPEAARAKFAEMWAEHILSLLDYARGHSTHDEAVREEAREESVEYEGELADYFVAQSGGRLDRPSAVSAVHAHAEHLLHDADAYAAGRYATAAAGYRQSYQHTYDLGLTLARALLPASATRSLDTPSVRLRSQLTELLGEHAALVMAMTRSASGNPTDFAAMGQALNANTLQLTAAIDALFGTPAAQRFQALWADQVDQLAAYNTAAVTKDDAGKERARAALGTFQTQLAAFLASATTNRITAAAGQAALADHDRMLLAEIDAYAAGDYEQAQQLAEQIHGAMFTLSGRLSDGIGATVAARLPRGGSQTGGGGSSRHHILPGP